MRDLPGLTEWYIKCVPYARTGLQDLIFLETIVEMIISMITTLLPYKSSLGPGWFVWVNNHPRHGDRIAV
jgi:hypothetical protein